MEDPVICIIVDGVRLLRNEGPTFMRHASSDENDSRAAHIADLVMLEDILSTVSLGLPVAFPPPVTMPVDASAAFPPSSPPLVVSPTPSDIALFDTFLN